jgi:uncharacterized LabA/DUF88 family protein
MSTTKLHRLVHKVAVFIDGGYLSEILRQNALRIDYHKLALWMAEECEGTLLRAYYYDCRPYQSSNPTEEEKNRTSQKNKFLTKVRNLDSFTVRLGRLQKIDAKTGPQFIQKGVDVQLCLDIVTLSAKRVIDSIALLSGDADLVPGVEAAKWEGVKVFLFAPSEDNQSARASTELKETCDSVISFNKDTLSKFSLDIRGE